MAEVWMAYRKAKKEAYYNNTVAYGLKFADFEINLTKNLEKIHSSVLDVNHTWADNPQRLGKESLVPKSLDPVLTNSDEPHFRESDPWLEWERQHVGEGKAVAKTRTVINATVEYLVISTLWALKVGDEYDITLLTPNVYANRLRRRFHVQTEDDEEEFGPINWDSHSLYQHYTYQYSKWRRDSLKATKKKLQNGESMIAISLDATSFYDSIDASFLLHKDYLKLNSVALSNEQRIFTEALIRSFRTWNAHIKRDRGIPIGLTASGLIANLILGPFDEQVINAIQPTFYGRFVDDIFFSFNSENNFRSSQTLINHLCRKIKWLEQTGNSLKASLPYAPFSEIYLNTKKQKIFRLQGQSGIDVLTAIEEHMRMQSSAHRMLPTLSTSESELADRTLLLNRDSNLATAVFREADIVSIRKAGLSEELSKMERISEVLDCDQWTDTRLAFYDLSNRHLIAPLGFFEFYIYLPRIAGLMAACGDWDQLENMLRALTRLRKLLRRTTTLRKADLSGIFANLAKRIELSTFKSLDVLHSEALEKAASAIREIRKVGEITLQGIEPKKIASACKKTARMRLGTETILSVGETTN